MRNGLHGKRLGAMLVPVLLMVSACAGPEQVKDAAPSVAAFHAALDQGDYAGIWNGASADLHGATQEPRFTRLLTAIHTQLGKVATSKQVGWKVNYSTGGHFIQVDMDTKFANGLGTEHFVFKDADKQLSLAGYGIDSTDLK